MPSRILDDEEIDTSYDLSSSKHIEEIRAEAIKCMTRFFAKKEYWAGGSIARSRLFKEEHIKAVMEMNVMDALAVAYYCLSKNKPDTVDTEKKGWDVELCYECLKECEQTRLDKNDPHSKIPKCHAGGILLVYLSLCHGVDFLPTMKKLAEIRAMVARREREAELKLLMQQQQDDEECVNEAS